MLLDDDTEGPSNKVVSGVTWLGSVEGIGKN